MTIYDGYGNKIALDSGELRLPIDYNKTMISVNHRGYSTVAPENTLPAYRLSKKMGFDYVETDVCFTSDNVPVLLHDGTIDRTSNGSGNINNMTFEQVRQYDFGSWKSSAYTGTKIPSLAEFLNLCKSIVLHPYIELKGGSTYTEEQIRQIVDMVYSYGLKGKVSYISFSSVFLGYVRDYDSEARLGFLKSAFADSDIATCNDLKTESNQVFYDVGYSAITQSVCDAFIAENIPIEAWTVNSADTMLGLNKYVSGITSDNLIAGKVLYDNAMSQSN